MQAQLLIASGKDSNMRYATGLAIPDPFIYADLGKNKYVIVPSLELARAKKEVKEGIKVVNGESIETENIREPKHRTPNLADLAASFLKSFNITDVLVPENMWTLHVETLREHTIIAKTKSPFYPERLHKTAEELDHIQRVGKVVIKAYEHLCALIKQATVEWDDELYTNGIQLTSEYLRAEAEKIFLSNGCESGETIIACGEHAAEPHNRGTGPLHAGKPIVIDMFPRCQTTGYYFDFTRTIVKGTPSKELLRMIETVKNAHDEVLAVVAPGKAAHLQKVAEEVFKKAGYQTTEEEGFIHSVGHGLGLDIHEPPRIGGKSKDTLEEGMVITVEPGLYYKELGGVRIEDTVLVTNDGHKNLTNVQRINIIE